MLVGGVDGHFRQFDAQGQAGHLAEQRFIEMWQHGGFASFDRRKQQAAHGLLHFQRCRAGLGRLVERHEGFLHLVLRALQRGAVFMQQSAVAGDLDQRQQGNHRIERGNCGLQPAGKEFGVRRVCVWHDFLTIRAFTLFLLG